MSVVLWLNNPTCVRWSALTVNDSSSLKQVARKFFSACFFEGLPTKTSFPIGLGQDEAESLLLDSTISFILFGGSNDVMSAVPD